MKKARILWMIGEIKMNFSSGFRFYVLGAVAVTALMTAGAVFADHLSGQVLGANAPIAKSTVVLWEASASAPKKLAETKTDEQVDSRFVQRLRMALIRASILLPLAANQRLMAEAVTIRQSFYSQCWTINHPKN
jgi:hypothetical protein